MMETIKLTIPNMKSTHCQMTVADTVRAIGAIVKSISPMKAEIELADGLTREGIILAIQERGYNVTN